MLTEGLLVVEFALVVSLCLLALRWVANRLALPGPVRWLVVGAFLLRTVVAVVVDSLGTFAGQFDFFKFDAALWMAAQLFRQGVFTAPLEIAAARPGGLLYVPYTAIYAPVYAVFGHHTLLMRVTFALVGTLLVLNVYRLGRELHSREAGLYAGAIAAVFPYWLYLSTIFYRDMLIMLLLSQLLVVLVRANRSYAARDAVAALVLGVVSIMLRPENAVAIGAAVAVVGASVVKQYGVAVRGGVLVTVAGATVVTLQRLISTTKDTLVLELAGRRRSLARGEAAYFEGVSYRNLAELVAFLPGGVLYLLLVPLPWQVDDALVLLAFVQNVLVWYPVLLLTVVGFPVLFSRRSTATLVMTSFTAAGVVAYALVEGNIGPALRHRSQFQLLFFVTAGVTLAVHSFAGISTRDRAGTGPTDGD